MTWEIILTVVFAILTIAGILVLDALVQTVFDGIERYAKKQVKKKAEKTDEDS